MAGRYTTKELARLRRSVEEWNWWCANDILGRSNVDFGNVDLRDAKLRKVNLSGASLVEADLRGADLSEANLSKANLSRANLSYANFSEANFYGAYLGDTNLSYANLYDTNLSYTNLIKADLSHTDLGLTQALNANFEGAILTGACIQDWDINSDTNLKGILCEYIFLQSELQNRKQIFTERHPSEPDRIFASGEFSRLYQIVQDGLSLHFQEGIDWRAFSTAFQSLQTEIDDPAFSVRAIENLDDGLLVIRINTPKDVHKNSIKQVFWKKYKPLLDPKNEQEEQVKCERGADLWQFIQMMVEKQTEEGI